MKAVLFVDDNQVLSRLSCDILQRAGYRAVPVYNGAEALDALEKGKFDIVVTDLRMEGMDGLQLARAVHDRNPDLPVIIVTAYDLVKAADIHACLPKEGLFPALIEQIRLCLAEVEAGKAS